MNIHNNARLMPIGRERIVMQGRPRCAKLSLWSRPRSHNDRMDLNESTS